MTTTMFSVVNLLRNEKLFVHVQNANYSQPISLASLVTRYYTDRYHKCVTKP